MDNVSKIAREPYEAPLVEDIPLRPEDQVLVTCKDAVGSAGPNGTCQFPNQCSSINPS
jgi:hypothetical protein